MISKAHEIVPPSLARELLRLARTNRRWVTWHHTGKTTINGEEYLTYGAKYEVPTYLTKIPGWRPSDAFSQLGMSLWLLDGPKTFRPTYQQCEALGQIEVRLTLAEYAQPYQAMLVELPAAWSPPYTSVLCYHDVETGLMTLSSFTADHRNEIVTTMTSDDKPIEHGIQRYDGDIASHLSAACGRALRVAINSCLALVNYGCQHEVLNRREYDRDRHFANHAKNEEARRAAKGRVATSVEVVSFAQHIELRGTSSTCHERDLDKTGRERGFGWVRGHWRMQAHGQNHSLRKRILIKPYMVRVDKLVVELSETSVEYKG